MAKRCTRCLEWKADSAFYRDRTKLDGLKSQCKECRKLYKRDYRDRLRAKTNARLRRTYKMIWRPKPQPAIRLDRTPGFKRWRERTEARRRLYLSEYLQQWHTDNPAESTTWIKNNREAIRVNRQARRAEQANVTVNDLNPEEWEWLLEVFDHMCAYCGTHSDHLTPDHIVPLAKGGANPLSNVVPACPTCNSRKGARTPAESEMDFVVHVDVTNALEQLALL